MLPVTPQIPLDMRNAVDCYGALRSSLFNSGQELGNTLGASLYACSFEEVCRVNFTDLQHLGFVATARTCVDMILQRLQTSYSFYYNVLDISLLPYRPGWLFRLHLDDSDRPRSKTQEILIWIKIITNYLSIVSVLRTTDQPTSRTMAFVFVIEIGVLQLTRLPSQRRLLPYFSNSLAFLAKKRLL